MALNRRGFLGVLATVAAGATLDPERALWVPGAKLISVPAARSVADILREIEQRIAAGMGIDYDAYLARKAAFGVSDEHWMRKKADNWIVSASVAHKEDPFVRELFAGM